MRATRGIRRTCCIGIALGCHALGFGVPAWAQWTAVRLHGTDDFRSACLSIHDQQQGGWRQANSQSPRQPVVWSGAAGTAISLATSSADTGEVRAVWQGHQGGQFGAPVGHASIWNGTPESRVDLDPGIAGTFGSAVQAMRDGQQAGYIVVSGGVPHAATWSGTSASFLDLNPIGAESSRANATDGVRQGGFAVVAAGQHAALWNGSAASFLDLNDPVVSGSSYILGMAPGQQVGAYFRLSGGNQHAAMWSGSAQSMVDLHPFAGTGASTLLATDGSIQVGNATVPGNSFVTAGVWFGTAASFVDLHAFLPAGYGSSSATSVFQSNGVIYIGGSAANPLTGQSEAFLWMSVPGPGSGAVGLAAMAIVARRRRGSAPTRPRH